MERRGQRFAVIVFILDEGTKYEEDREPIFVWLASFDTIQECKSYIEDTAKDKVKDYDMYAVDMYEWLDPTVLEKNKDELNESYRNPELNKVMRRRKIEKNRVKSFQEWCKESGIETPVTEITRDGKVSGNDMRGGKVRKNPLASTGTMSKIPIVDEEELESKVKSKLESKTII